MVVVVAMLVVVAVEIAELVAVACIVVLTVGGLPASSQGLHAVANSATTKKRAEVLRIGTSI
jgi:hypothetical protein